MAAPPLASITPKLASIRLGLVMVSRKMAEVLHRGTNLQSTVDNPPVGGTPFFPVLHFHQIVGLGVHQAKPAELVPTHASFKSGKLSLFTSAMKSYFSPFT